MPLRCTICRSRSRAAIDGRLLTGESLRKISHRFKVGEDSLGRHRKHMRSAVVKAAAVVEAKEIAYGSRLLAEIGRIRADAERLQAEAEGQQDIKTALVGIRQRLHVCELEARLSGEIESGTRLTVNVAPVLDEAAMLRIARTILARHAPLELSGAVNLPLERSAHVGPDDHAKPDEA